MSQKTIKSAAIVGAAFVGSLATFSVANANENPFSATQLDSGYMQLAEADKEGKCGEGKCGGDMKDGKDMEGKCGGDKEGSKDMEGKCGEGKCGGKT